MPNSNALQKDSQGERASLTGQTAPDSTDADVNGKRKEPPAATGTRFKAVGTMVLAMRRFQASLNPTITFGKQTSSAGGSASSSGAVSPGPEASSVPRGPMNAANRGKLQRTNTPTSRNRMALVMQPLPDVVDV